MSRDSDDHVTGAAMRTMADLVLRSVEIARTERDYDRAAFGPTSSGPVITDVELRALAELVATAERNNPKFAYTTDTTLVEVAAENGVRMYEIRGSAKDAAIHYTAGPYPCKKAAEHLQCMLQATIGD